MWIDQLVKQLRNCWRVAVERVKQSRAEQADDGAQEKSAKHKLFLKLNFHIGSRQKVHRYANKWERTCREKIREFSYETIAFSIIIQTDQMSPDVACLGVDPEHRLEAFFGGGQRRPMTLQ